MKTKTERVGKKCGISHLDIYKQKVRDTGIKRDNRKELEYVLDTGSDRCY